MVALFCTLWLFREHLKDEHVKWSLNYDKSDNSFIYQNRSGSNTYGLVHLTNVYYSQSTLKYNSFESSININKRYGKLVKGFTINNNDRRIHVVPLKNSDILTEYRDSKFYLYWYLDVCKEINSYKNKKYHITISLINKGLFILNFVFKDNYGNSKTIPVVLGSSVIKIKK